MLTMFMKDDYNMNVNTSKKKGSADETRLGLKQEYWDIV